MHFILGENTPSLTDTSAWLCFFVNKKASALRGICHVKYKIKTYKNVLLKQSIETLTEQERISCVVCVPLLGRSTACIDF